MPSLPGYYGLVMRAPKYDIIGDIHGQYDKLIALLERLGYEPFGNHYRHPEDRKVIFLGDYIDRGPKIRETLHLVRHMQEAGEALAIMGNHEFDAIAYHTPDGRGGFLRERNRANIAQHAVTIAAFVGLEDEWAGWVRWMRGLPFFIDLGELRAVHAAWDESRIAKLRGKSLLDDAFLHAAASKGSDEFSLVEVLLNGPELRLPEGVFFVDHQGIHRSKVRVRWWDLSDDGDIGSYVFPSPLDYVKHPISRDQFDSLPNYPADAPAVFIGHYWLPAHWEKLPLAANIAGVDYSAGLGEAPLVAYRWDGGPLRAEGFASSVPPPAPENSNGNSSRNPKTIQHKK